MSKLEDCSKHTEEIICPNCGSLQIGEVKHTSPWWNYGHICSNCEYYISESEWRRTNEHKQIFFDNNYPKLHGQKTARLCGVLTSVKPELLEAKFPGLIEFDTTRDDGRRYAIKNDETYMLLLFIGEKWIMFPTLRKENKENLRRYADSIGETFEIVIIEEK